MPKAKTPKTFLVFLANATEAGDAETVAIIQRAIDDPTDVNKAAAWDRIYTLKGHPPIVPIQGMTGDEFWNEIHTKPRAPQTPEQIAQQEEILRKLAAHGGSPLGVFTIRRPGA